MDVFVGIDIGKESHFAVVLDGEGLNRRFQWRVICLSASSSPGTVRLSSTAKTLSATALPIGSSNRQ